VEGGAVFPTIRSAQQQHPIFKFLPCAHYTRS
jgi:hypothetical protein